MRPRRFFETRRHWGPARLGRLRSASGTGWGETPALVLVATPSLDPSSRPDDPHAIALRRLAIEAPTVVSPEEASPGRFVHFGGAGEELDWLVNFELGGLGWPNGHGRRPTESPVHLLHASPVPFLDQAPELYRQTLGAVFRHLEEVHGAFDFANDPRVASWYPWHARDHDGGIDPGEAYRRNPEAYGGVQVTGVAPREGGTARFPFRFLLRTFEQLHSALLPNVPVLLSGPAYPDDYSLLSCLGVDLFDSTGPLAAAARRHYFLPSGGVVPLDQLNELPCSCPVCWEATTGGALSYRGLLLHDLLVAYHALGELRRALKVGTFWAKLEADAHASTAHAACLRWLYFHGKGLLEPRAPRLGLHPSVAVGAEAHQRPDHARFRRQVVERFQPAPDTAAVLLLPCSAKKPYSKSRSHRAFARVVKGALKGERAKLQELVVTSPLGCVPRQLEGYHPANGYDVPVTGDWDDEETSLVAGVVRGLLEKVPRGVPVVAHVSGGYRRAVELAVEGGRVELEFTGARGKESSPENLSLLESTLSSLAPLSGPSGARDGGGWAPSSPTGRVAARVDFQFGRGAGGALVGGGVRSRFDRRTRTERVYDGEDGRSLGRWEEREGRFVPEGRGVARLLGFTDLVLKLDGDQLQGSTLFAPGVLGAPEAAAPGDIVLVVGESGEPLGVAEMVVPGVVAGRGGEGPVARILRGW
ncbi:MAG: hypothetical protein Kow0069_21250 [Promethearchaeota archaeon]